MEINIDLVESLYNMKEDESSFYIGAWCSGSTRHFDCLGVVSSTAAPAIQGSLVR